MFPFHVTLRDWIVGLENASSVENDHYIIIKERFVFVEMEFEMPFSSG